jgi:DNA polymerase-3 subunit delta'
MARARTIDAEIEAPPEADRLEGWPHPRETGRVLGHGAAEEMFLAALGSGRLHHAWLMTGAEGIGKAAFAYRAARFLLSREGEPPEAATSLDVPGDGRAARQVANLSHPGLLSSGAPGTHPRRNSARASPSTTSARSGISSSARRSRPGVP